MTVFQIQGAGDDPITRYLAFWSLVCALVSLLYGCLFIIRFGTMRKPYKAAEWALEAKNTQTVVWNGGVMLAMPGVWLAWSILTFMGCLMSFMWRAPTNLPSDFVFMVKPSTELGFRIFICVVLLIGTGYGVLILDTFRRYGTRMDEAWKNHVNNFLMEDQPSCVPPSCVPPPRRPHLHWPPRSYTSPYSPHSLSQLKKLHRFRPGSPPPPNDRRGQDIAYVGAPNLGTPKSAVLGSGHDLSGNHSLTLAPVDTSSERRRRKRSVSRGRQRSRPPSNYTSGMPSQTRRTSPLTPLPMAESSTGPRLSRRTKPEISQTQSSYQANPESRPLRQVTLQEEHTSPTRGIALEPSGRNSQEVDQDKNGKRKRKKGGKG